MLGDLFGTRGNYELGLLYASRRKFLVSAGQNSLEAPDDFKTKQQIRRASLRKKESSQSNKANFVPAHHIMPVLSQHPPPTKKESDPVSSNSPSVTSAKKVFRKTAQFVVERERVEWVDGESDGGRWKEEVVAGVRLWTDVYTGEVLCESPYRQRETKRRPFESSSDENSSSSKENEFGTGWLVYESNHVDELFEMLDAHK